MLSNSVNLFTNTLILLAVKTFQNGGKYTWQRSIFGDADNVVFRMIFTTFELSMNPAYQVGFPHARSAN
ncbi:hypothetical protein C3460_11705 [Serratia marcescens]|nr:hypothetical protein C3462_13245 [Serratia marcescens]POX00953.1 hypothetical protein C3466_13265 [Serratia marcescens]POX14892.1 hypothetical protein C3460_11705 [Serratia marcescens]PQH26039.1 hypothetical protein C5T93_13000 [Raoultella ornithinolytica]